MTIGKNPRNSSVRSSIRAPKFLDKASGFYGRLDEPEAAGEGGEVRAEEVEDMCRKTGDSSRDGGVACSPSVAHTSGADEREEVEGFDLDEGMMEDDGETLLQRKPSRRSSRWRRSSRRKPKVGRGEEDAARDDGPSLGTGSPADPHAPEDSRLMIEVETEEEKEGGKEDAGRGKEPALAHFPIRGDADDQVLIRDKKRGREEGGEEERRKEKQEDEEGVSPWETDYQLLVCEGLFSEYLEMVIQFGFITIFVAACPLAPLFALINNWVEIRLDAQKFVTEYRRPVAERAQDIGIWFPILQFITHMAVLSNAFLIAFTSSFLPRLYYGYTKDHTLTGFINFTLATSPRNYSQTQTSCRYLGFRDANGDYLPEYFHLLAIRLTFVIVFEHVVFSIGRLIDMMVPDVPEEVELKMKREHYMAKQALAENQSLGKSLIPGEREVLFRGPVSRPPGPPQRDSTPPDLKGIQEETSTPGSC